MESKKTHSMNQTELTYMHLRTYKL